MWLYIRKRYIFIFFLLALGSILWWQEAYNSDHDSHEDAALSKSKLGAPLFNYIGVYHKPIMTQSQLVQRYFNQGLILYYGFNYAESVRSFKEAVHLDSECAMCYWGLALALGSKSNTPLNGNERREALEAIRIAQKLAMKSSPADRAYIEALAQRYQTKYNATITGIGKVTNDCIGCRGKAIVTREESRAYSDAMKKVVEQFPNDIDAKNLYVAALLDAADWNLYTPDQEPNVDALEIISVLESALKDHPKNLAAHHFYIHAIAPSKEPERALPSADHLRRSLPGMRQFAHMPAHIYVLTGRYNDATVANQRAIAAYKEYVGEAWGQGFEPKKNFLYLHDLFFLWTTATLQGRSQLAIETADELSRQTPRGGAKEAFFQIYYATPYFARVRFGRWNEIIDEPQPPTDMAYQTMMWHYARGMAFVHLGNLNNAQAELKKMQELKQRSAVSTPGNIEEVQQNIALTVLEATIANKQGRHADVVFKWRKAINLQEAFGNKHLIWYFPLREGLADVLLQMHRPKEAEAEYLLALKLYPENGWSLFGLAQSLRAQGKYLEAEKVQERFKYAWSRADFTIPEIRSRH